MELGDPQELKEKMLGRLQEEIHPRGVKTLKAKPIRKTKLLQYAASVVLIAGAAYTFIHFSKNTSTALVPADQTDAIVLKLDNGNVDVITEHDQKKITDSKGNVVGYQKGNTIAYEQDLSPTKELVFNELTVPLGKRFDLVLSDGSRVKLNAGSTIKYPIQFIQGRSREVEIWGEAYFDVTTDKEHPFLVNANNIQVKVLGTKFNVSSYSRRRRH